MALLIAAAETYALLEVAMLKGVPVVAGGTKMKLEGATVTDARVMLSRLAVPMVVTFVRYVVFVFVSTVVVMDSLLAVWVADMVASVVETELVAVGLMVMVSWTVMYTVEGPLQIEEAISEVAIKGVRCLCVSLGRCRRLKIHTPLRTWKGLMELKRLQSLRISVEEGAL